MRDNRAALKNEVFETMSKLRSLVSALVYEDTKKKSVPWICEEAIKRLAPALGTTPERIVMRSSSPDVVLPRQICQYVMRECLHVSFADIAIATGLADSSTPHYSWDKIDKMRIANERFDKKIRELCGLLLDGKYEQGEVA